MDMMMSRWCDCQTLSGWFLSVSLLGDNLKLYKGDRQNACWKVRIENLLLCDGF